MDYPRDTTPAKVKYSFSRKVFDFAISRNTIWRSEIHTPWSFAGPPATVHPMHSRYHEAEPGYYPPKSYYGPAPTQYSPAPTPGSADPRYPHWTSSSQYSSWPMPPPSHGAPQPLPQAPPAYTRREYDYYGGADYDHRAYRQPMMPPAPASADMMMSYGPPAPGMYYGGPVGSYPPPPSHQYGPPPPSMYSSSMYGRDTRGESYGPPPSAYPIYGERPAYATSGAPMPAYPAPHRASLYGPSDGGTYTRMELPRKASSGSEERSTEGRDSSERSSEGRESSPERRERSSSEGRESNDRSSEHSSTDAAELERNSPPSSMPNSSRSNSF